MTQKAPHKHHYIPCFYTKRWTGKDGRLVEYSRPYESVISRWKHPKAVGYKDNLYTVSGLDGAPDSSLETGFFSPVDQAADRAITHLLSSPSAALPLKLRRAFTGLLLSFLHRTPDRIERLSTGLVEQVDIHFEDLERKIAQGEKVELPEGKTLDEVKAFVKREAETRDWAKVLVSTIGSQVVGNHTINMQWYLRDLRGADHGLLTSDKPLIHYNGMSHHDANMALPLGPRHLFIATNNDATAENILSVSDTFLARRVNHEVCRLAQRYIYGATEGHLRFIESRWGMPYCSPDPPKGKPLPNTIWKIL